MKEVRIIETELGGVPVTLEKVKDNGEEFFLGEILGEKNIFIQTKTEAFCLNQLKKAFECSMHFWVRNQISNLKLNYEGKISKDWYNEW